MIALDTNVLARFLLQDDKPQTAKATALFEEAIAAGEQLFLSDVVVCEIVWVLNTTYHVPRGEVARTLTELTQAAYIAFRDSESIVRALAAFRAGRGDFADYLIREHARAAGCQTVLTFDRPLLKEPGFASP